MLTQLWFIFFAISFISACYQWLINGQAEIFSVLIQSTFDMAGLSVEIAIGLIGVLALWLGFFKIAERAGMVQLLSRFLEPLFLKLMPDVKQLHLGGDMADSVGLIMNFKRQYIIEWFRVYTNKYAQKSHESHGDQHGLIGFAGTQSIVFGEKYKIGKFNAGMQKYTG